MNSRILHRTLGRSVGALSLAVVFPPERSADQRPTFKSEVDLVAINVVLINKTAANGDESERKRVSIGEDSRPQLITHFTKDPLPLSVAVALETGCYTIEHRTS